MRKILDYMNTLKKWYALITCRIIGFSGCKNYGETSTLVYLFLTVSIVLGIFSKSSHPPLGKEGRLAVPSCFQCGQRRTHPLMTSGRIIKGVL